MDLTLAAATVAALAGMLKAPPASMRQREVAKGAATADNETLRWDRRVGKRSNMGTPSSRPIEYRWTEMCSLRFRFEPGSQAAGKHVVGFGGRPDLSVPINQRTR